MGLTISQLPAAVSVTALDISVIVQSNVTKRATISQIITLILENGGFMQNGAINPDPSVGANGDFYIKTGASPVLFGPKASGVWPTGTPLIGPVGPTGGTGPQGPAGPSGVLAWMAKTANYTALANDAIIADTVGGIFTITLPASPTIGQSVYLADGSGTWGTNNLTVARNGHNIASSATDLVCNISGVPVTLVYYNSTVGWIVR